jgi:protein TonB
MTAVRTAKVPLYSSPGSARTASRRVFAASTRSTSPVPHGTATTVPRLLEQPRESWRGVAWMLAVAACFVSAGLAGAARPVVDLQTADRGKAEPPAPAVPVEDITMADLADSPDEPEAAAGPLEEPVPAEEKPMLTEEDIFEVPPAAPIETALRIFEPAPVKTAPAPQPRRTDPAKTRPATSASVTGGSPSPTAEGAGGTAAAGSGGKGKFPKPPYPAFAKAKGLTGTVSLSVRVSAAGDVTSASVAGSSGSSELDSYAASWVTRRWKWPAGAARSFRLPVSFRLR